MRGPVRSVRNACHLCSVAPLLLGAAVVGCGDAREVSRSEVETSVVLGVGASIFGGASDDDGHAVGSVVALKVGRGGSFELCSAAIIAANVVLTARHCVAKRITRTVSCDENGRSTNGAHIRGDDEPANVRLYVGASPDLGGRADAIGRAIVAPETDHLCDSDIALVILDRALVHVTPIPVRLDRGVTIRDTIRSVGYGQNDRRLPFGTRLRKTGVPVLATGSGISKSKTALGDHEFEVGISTCLGDSGGPALSERSGAVVGVVSRGGGCDDDYGHVYTTTSGWSALFERAFAIAGGAPVREYGEPWALDEAPKPSAGADGRQGCVVTSSSAWDAELPLVLALGWAAFVRARRPRSGRA